MTPTDEAARLDQESRRGEAAARILEDPLFIEARQRVYDDLTELRRRSGFGDEKLHSRLILMEQLAGRFFDYFTETLQTGKFASKTLLDQRSAMDRMREHVKRFSQLGRNAF